MTRWTQRTTCATTPGPWHGLTSALTVRLAQVPGRETRVRRVGAACTSHTIYYITLTIVAMAVAGKFTTAHWIILYRRSDDAVSRFTLSPNTDYIFTRWLHALDQIYNRRRDYRRRRTRRTDRTRPTLVIRIHSMLLELLRRGALAEGSDGTGPLSQ